MYVFQYSYGINCLWAMFAYTLNIVHNHTLYYIIFNTNISITDLTRIKSADRKLMFVDRYRYSLFLLGTYHTYTIRHVLWIHNNISTWALKICSTVINRRHYIIQALYSNTYNLAADKSVIMYNTIVTARF